MFLFYLIECCFNFYERQMNSFSPICAEFLGNRNILNMIYSSFTQFTCPNIFWSTSSLYLGCVSLDSESLFIYIFSIGVDIFEYHPIYTPHLSLEQE